jgi:hypothetical protein
LEEGEKQIKEVNGMRVYKAAIKMGPFTKKLKIVYSQQTEISKCEVSVK